MNDSCDRNAGKPQCCKPVSPERQTDEDRVWSYNTLVCFQEVSQQRKYLYIDWWDQQPSLSSLVVRQLKSGSKKLCLRAWNKTNYTCMLGCPYFGMYSVFVVHEVWAGDDASACAFYFISFFSVASDARAPKCINSSKLVWEKTKKHVLLFQSTVGCSFDCMKNNCISHYSHLAPQLMLFREIWSQFGLWHDTNHGLLESLCWRVTFS